MKHILHRVLGMLLCSACGHPKALHYCLFGRCFEQGCDCLHFEREEE